MSYMSNMHYPPREKVNYLTENLNTKAYNYPNHRFNNLYSHLLDYNVIKYSYDLVKRKNGCSGIDRMSFGDIERDGLNKFINSILHDLHRRRYNPSPNRTVLIPKGESMFRKLSIPTIRDRVVQKGISFLLNPIFEPSFHDFVFGYRPKLSPTDAVYRVKDYLQADLTSVFDVDLEKCFDSLNQDLVLNTLYKRVSDKDLIILINRFLNTPTNINGVIEKSTGIPQGGVTSPLFSNLALHHLDDFFFHNKPKNLIAGMVRYADDFLIMTENENNALYQIITDYIEEMGLKLNPKKTSINNMRMGLPLNYLGYSIRVKRVKPLELAIKPREKNIVRMKATIVELLKDSDSAYKEIEHRLTSFESYYSASTCPEIFDDLRNYAFKAIKA